MPFDMSKKTILLCLIPIGLFLINTAHCYPTSTNTIVKPQVTIIRFATEVYPPFTTIDANKKLEGFDIEVAKALCEKINAKCTFSENQFDNMVPSLQNKKYDAWISAITIIDKHRKDNALTEPYFSSTAQLIATDATVFNAAPVEIKDKTIGVVEHGRYLRFLKKTYGNIIKIKVFSAREDALAALNNNSIDAVIDDAMVIKNWLLSQANRKKYRQINLPAKYANLVWHRYGIAVAKDNTKLLQALNNGISLIKDDGTLNKLIKKYFAK